MDTNEQIAKMKLFAEEISKVSTHPEYLKMLKDLEELPTEERSNYVLKNMTPDKLREKGIDLPESFRLTTRYFEDPQSEVIQGKRIDFPVDSDSGDTILSKDTGFEGPKSSLTACLSLGYIGCISVGDQF